MIIFTKNLFTLNPYDKLVQTNKLLFERLTEMRSLSESAKVISILYVDINHDGELLKETFDIETVPSVRIIS